MKSITKLNIVDEMLLKKMAGGGGGGDTEMQLIGTYRGNQTIDVSEYKKDGDALNNFIIEIISANSATTGERASGSRAQANIAGFTVSKSLSGNSLVVGGMTQVLTCYNSWDPMKATQTLTYNVWHC